MMASTSYYLKLDSLRMSRVPGAVADPGFPVEGAHLAVGALTPEEATVRKICMSKRKNLDPYGARAGSAPGSANEGGVHAVKNLQLSNLILQSFI